MSNTNNDRFDERPDLDAAVAVSLARLAGGRGAEFAEIDPPPDAIADWLARADKQAVRGLLCLTLRRWHEMGG